MSSPALLWKSSAQKCQCAEEEEGDYVDYDDALLMAQAMPNSMRMAMPTT